MLGIKDFKKCCETVCLRHVQIMPYFGEIAKTFSNIDILCSRDAILVNIQKHQDSFKFQKQFVSDR